MKNLQKLFSMAMLVCMAVAMFSCSKDDEEVSFTEAEVVGKWSITSTDNDLKLSDLDGKNLDLTDVFSGEDIVLSEGETLVLKEEGDLTVGSVIYSIEGSWKLVDGKKLYLSQKDAKEGTEFIIQSMNEESAVLVQPVTLGEVSFNYIYNLKKN